jgi:REP element-mobilizing transposase RayT
MARANRHHIPGQVWHITQRCHKKAFLLILRPKMTLQASKTAFFGE